MSFTAITAGQLPLQHLEFCLHPCSVQLSAAKQEQTGQHWANWDCSHLPGGWSLYSQGFGNRSTWCFTLPLAPNV